MVKRKSKMATPKQAPFVVKLNEMLIDPEFMHICGFSAKGDTFVIHDADSFVENVLPAFFKHSRMRSFSRQLNLYGFRKCYTVSTIEYRHPFFHRDRPNLHSQIQRNKSAQTKEIERQLNQLTNSSLTLSSFAPSNNANTYACRRRSPLRLLSVTPSDTNSSVANGSSSDSSPRSVSSSYGASEKFVRAELQVTSTDADIDAIALDDFGFDFSEKDGNQSLDLLQVKIPPQPPASQCPSNASSRVEKQVDSELLQADTSVRCKKAKSDYNCLDEMGRRVAKHSCSPEYEAIFNKLPLTTQSSTAASSAPPPPSQIASKMISLKKDLEQYVNANRLHDLPFEILEVHNALQHTLSNIN